MVAIYKLCADELDEQITAVRQWVLVCGTGGALLIAAIISLLQVDAYAGDAVEACYSCKGPGVGHESYYGPEGSYSVYYSYDSETGDRIPINAATSDKCYIDDSSTYCEIDSYRIGSLVSIGAGWYLLLMGGVGTTLAGFVGYLTSRPKREEPA